DIDHETAGIETTSQRVTVTVGGHQHTGEIQSQTAVTQGFRIVTITFRVVKRTFQGEQVAAVRLDLQGEDRSSSRRRVQGGAVIRHAVSHGHVARCQAQRLQIRQRSEFFTQVKAATAIGPKMHQCIQGAWATLNGQGLTALGIAVAQRIFMYQAAHAWPLTRRAGKYRYIVLNVNDEATAGKTIDDRIAISIGGNQYAGEVQRQAVIAKGFGVDTVRLLMVQRALEREQVAAIAIHLEVEDLAATFTSRSGERGAIRRDDVEQRNTAGAQAKCLQSRQRTGLLAQVETTTTIGAEVDQYIQCADTPLNREGLFRLAAGLGIAVTQGIFMHQPADHRLLRIGLGRQRHVILNVDDEQAFRAFRQLQRIAVAISSGEQV